MIRDEAPYIAEWLEFHRLVGVSRFVLYDDGSVDGTLDVVQEHDRGDIVVRLLSDEWDSPAYNGAASPLKGWEATRQPRAFRHYACTTARDHWCAFIDPDEYLFHDTIDSLPLALEPLEGACCVVTNWVVFGSSGHRTKPDGLTVENYTRRAKPGQPEPWGRHVKPIVNMSFPHAWGPHGAHCPIFGQGTPVTCDGNASPWSMVHCPSILPLRLNHYYHRSHVEAAEKLKKDYRFCVPGYPSAERIAMHDRNEVEDTSILRFLPALKKALE